MTTQRHSGVVPEWTLGDRLRKARATTGLNTADFAKLIGMSQKSVNNAEGDKHEVRRIVLNAWVAATGVSPQWLEHGIGSPRPGPPAIDNRDDLRRLTEAKRERARTTRGQAPTTRYLIAA